MSLAEERAPVLAAHKAWEAGDFPLFMSYIHDDILHVVNVDGMSVPYAMSGVGKVDVSQRLQLILDTFDVTTFEVEHLVHEAESTRTRVHGIYRHKKTGENLDIHLRFRGWVRDGLIIRIEETLDARYIEAFERFVHHMTIAAGERG